jgi:hypothetical protein
MAINKTKLSDEKEEVFRNQFIIQTIKRLVNAL